MELVAEKQELTRRGVLLVSANPHGARKELLEYEAEQIKAMITGKEGLPNLTLTQITVGSDEELEKALRDVRPSIVQISGAASPNGEPMLRSKRGRIRSLTGRVLADVIRGSKFHPECIFMSGYRVARQLGVLQDVAKSVISIRCKQYSFDYSVLASKLFYSHLRVDVDFQTIFKEMKSSIHDLGIGSAYATRFYLMKPPAVHRARTIDRAIGGSESELSTYEPDFDIAAFSRSIPSTDFLHSLPQAVESQSDEKDKLYRVWYGTNRQPVVENGRVVDYDNNRGKQTSYGICDVHIPQHHKIGSVGSPWWRRWPKFWEDDQLLLKRVEEFAEDAFWKSICQFFQNQSEAERVLLIYVHGYKTTFQDAAIRTAQLGIDLGVKGAAAFFSWPSKGHLMGYAADEAAIEASEGALGNFILEMANRSGADKVHLIAHSMGNRGVLRAFTRAVDKVAGSLNVPFGQVFLAAPDIDVDLFKQLSHVYPKLADRTTLYVSQKDKALLSSGILHDYPRAGYVPPVTVVNDVDTIEVTSIDLTFLGHGYVAEAKSVLTDMHQLMESGTSPSRRFGLAEVLLGSGLRYWRLKP